MFSKVSQSFPPPISPVLVEHLEQTYPMTYFMGKDTMEDVARYKGVQDVIAYLKYLLQCNEENTSVLK